MAQKIDISGQRFGHLICLGDSGKRASNKKIIWHFKCDCGNDYYSLKDNVLRMKIPSCGCHSIMKKISIGDKFGKLTVIDKIGSDGESIIWKCKCDCGKIVNKPTKTLNSGQVKSCGCARHETGEKLKKYNARDRKLYFRWSNIKGRCLNPNDPAYKNYGERGITICDEWKDDFYSFRDWAIANGYDEYLSIDRIDNDKGYSPDNCRWTDKKTQANNRRTNRLITIDGITKTMAEWCEVYKINYNVVQNRLYKYHMSDYDAITKPVRKKLPNGQGRRYKANHPELFE